MKFDNINKEIAYLQGLIVMLKKDEEMFGLTEPDIKRLKEAEDRIIELENYNDVMSQRD